MSVRHTFAAATALLTLATTTSICYAQEWLGVKPADRSAWSAEAVFADPEFAPLPVRAVSNLYRGPDGATMHSIVQDLAGISRRSRDSGEVIWGRIAGRPSDHETADYLRRQLALAGVMDIKTFSVPLKPFRNLSSAKLTLLADPSYGAATRDLVLTSAMPDRASPDTSGLDAPLVYAGTGREIDLVGRDVRGKIAVIRSAPKPGAFFATAAGAPDALVKKGAVGVITIYDVPVDVVSVPGALGSDTAPTFTLGSIEGAFLEALIAKSASTVPLRARIEVAGATITGATTENLIATVPGRSDEVIVVMAHTDSYFEGANDNGSGVATLLALARHYASSKTPPQRTMKFVLTGAHHGGFAGSTALMEQLKDVMPKIAFVLNCEHVASSQIVDSRNMVPAWGSRDGWHSSNSETPKYAVFAHATPKLRKAFNDAVTANGVVMESRSLKMGGGDSLIFERSQVPVVLFIEVGNWYHTSADIPAMVPSNGLERAARAYAELLAATEKMPFGDLRQ